MRLGNDWALSGIRLIPITDELSVNITMFGEYCSIVFLISDMQAKISYEQGMPHI